MQSTQTPFAGLLTPVIAPDGAARADSLGPLRQAGAAAASRAGLPTRRVEQWKYTSLNTLLDRDWTEGHAAISGDTALPDHGLDAVERFEITFLNGQVRDLEALKSSAPRGLSLQSLSEAVQDAGFAATVGADLPVEAYPMAALNAARIEDGLVIHIADGAMIDPVVALRFHAAGLEDGALAVHPRVIVVAGDGSSATLAEIHDGVGDGFVLSNPVVELRIGEKAHIGHYKLQAEQAGRVHTATGSVVCRTGSVYDGFVLHLGHGLARNELRVLLDGEHIEARVNGAYVGTGEAHIDNTTFIDHARPHCTSREVYKGVLDDRARGVFQAKILVRPDAQKTDGHQLNRALMLSPGAEIDSKPELEIYADDVQCSHGATAGELDEDQLFYLRARGIEEGRARALLVQAFLLEAVEMVEKQSVRDAFLALVAARLGDVFDGRDA